MVEQIFIHYDLKKSIKLDLICYLSSGYFFCYRKTMITKYLLSYLNFLALF